MSVVATEWYEAVLAELQCRHDEVEAAIAVLQRVIAERRPLPLAIQVVPMIVPVEGIEFIYEAPHVPRQAPKSMGIGGVYEYLANQILQALETHGRGLVSRDLLPLLKFKTEMSELQQIAQQRNVLAILGSMGQVMASSTKRDGSAIWTLTDEGRAQVLLLPHATVIDENK